MKQIFTLIVLCFTLIRFSEASTLSSTSTYNPEYAKGPIKNLISWFQAGPSISIAIATINDILIPTGSTTTSVVVTLSGYTNSPDIIVYLYDEKDNLISKNPITVSLGNLNQSYTFTSVSVGTYYVKAEIKLKATNNSNVFSVKSSDLSLSTENGFPACYGMTNGEFIINPGPNAVLPVTYVVKDATTDKLVYNGTNPVITGLPGNASYSISATDAAGKTGKYKGSVPVGEDTQISFDKNSTSIIDAKGCNNGEIIVAASGGSGDLSYSISGCTSLTQANGDFKYLSAPCLYTINAIDNQNTKCFISLPINIKQTVTPEFDTTSIVSTPVKCFGESTGDVTIKVTGGTAPYTYTLTGSPSSGAIAAKFWSFPKAQGTYVATVTDANGCSITKTVNVTQPAAALTLNLTETDVKLCIGSANGTITADAKGGTSATGNYTFALTPNEGTSKQAPAGIMVYSGLTAKAFNVTVTDDKNCTLSKNITVNAPVGTPLTVSIDTSYISCNGMTIPDGSATLQGAGGNSGHTPANEYKYAYTPLGGTPASYSPTFTTTPFVASKTLAAGNYTAWVQDGNGCVDSAYFTIATFKPIVVTLNPAAVTGCNGAATGSIAATVNGGYYDINKKITYSISPGTNHTGDVSGNYTGLKAGIYTITATDSKGCSNSSTTTVAEPSKIVITPPTTTPTLCHGDANGKITVTANGGNLATTAIYTIRQLPAIAYNKATSGFSSVPAGTYSIIVSDGACSDSVTNVIVADAPLLNLTTGTATNVKCFGGNTGSIPASATGGTGTLTYSISPNVGTQDVPFTTFSQLTANTTPGYIITVTDGNLCTKKSAAIPVTQPLKGVSFKTPIVKTPITTCPGDFTGAITPSAQDGTPPYTFTLSPNAVAKTGSPSVSFPGLKAGNNYAIRLVDAAGCAAPSDSTGIILTEPAAIVVDTINSTQPLCSGASNGTITLTAKQSGITVMGSFTLTGTKGAPAQIKTSTTAAGVTFNVAADTYTVSFKSTLNGCLANNTFILNKQPSKIVINPITPLQTQCHGSATGTIPVTANGGNGSALSYTIRQLPAITYNKVSSQFSNVPAGTYSIIVSDGTCSDSITNIVVTDAPDITLTLGTATNVKCFGGNTGSIPASAIGGTGTLTYSISPNVGTQDVPFTTFSQLTANTTPGYIITVTDGNLCTKKSAAIPVTQPAKGVSFKTPIVKTPITTCPGDFTGAITPSAQDGTPPYTFTLSPNAVAKTGSPSVSFPGLGAGNNYAIRLVDAAGCAAPSDSTGIILTEPAAIVVDTVAGTVKGPLCNGAANGSITFTAKQAGALVPGTFTLTGLKTAAQINVSLTGSAIFNNLAADTYTVSFKSTAKGCTGSDIVILTQPAKIIITTPTTTTTTCHGSATGTITVTASGGKTGSTLTYSIRQLPAITYNKVSPQFSYVPAGTYSIIVSDGTCSDSVTNVIVADAPLLNLTTGTATNVKCFGGNTGSIPASATGGTGTLTYSISPNVGTQDVPFTTFRQLTANTTPGYIITVTDGNLCTKKSAAIPVTQPLKGVSFKTPIVKTPITTCPGDFTGAITPSAQDGTPPYTFTLSPNAVAKTGSPSVSFPGLKAGNNYAIHLVDAAGCAAPDSTGIIITEPAPIIIDTITGAVKDPNCFNRNDGTISLIATQNGAPIAGTFTLTNSKGISLTPLNSTLPTGIVKFTSVPAETYKATFKSTLKGCSDTLTNIVLKNPTLLSITKIQVDSTKCNGDATGKITVTASGGTNPYKYYKDGVENAIAPFNIFDNLSSKSYSILVEDKNNCQATQNVTVEQPTAIQIASAKATNLKCAGELTSGQIDISVVGGTTPYTFALSNGFTSKNGQFKGLTTGTYTYTVTDKNGCSIASSSSLTVGTPTVAFAFEFTSSTAKCNGDGGRITFTTITGGSAPYEYSYDNGTSWTSTSDSLKVKDGTYNLMVGMKGYSCKTASKPITLVSPTALSLTATANAIQGCYGDKTGTITVTTPTTGTAPYKYALNDTITIPFQTLPTNTFSSLLGGDYKVWVKDANGCKLSINKTITQPTLLGITYKTTQIDAKNAKGTITVTDTTGGTGAKSFLVYTSGATPGTYDNTLPKTYAGLSAGSYIVEIKDAKNCIERDTVLIYNTLDVTVDSKDVTCKSGNDGSITLTPKDGTPSYKYTLFKAGIQKDTKTQADKASVTFNTLVAGTYTVTVSDNSNMFFTRNITLKNTDSVTFVATSTPVSCKGTTGGTITVSSVTGSGGYSYSLDGKVNSPSSSNLFSDLVIGDHILKVTDNKGCSTIDTIPIVAETGITLGLVQPTTSDDGTPSGAFTVKPLGGANYEYSVNNGAWQTNATKIFSPLAAGTYVIKAREVSTGCISNDTTAVIKNSYNTLDVTPFFTNNNCTGDTKGSFRLHIVGGLSPITISVKNSSGTAVPSVANSADTLYQNLANGKYDINIIDKASKVYKTTITISNTSNLSLNPLTITTPVCYNDTTVAIIAQAQGSNPANYSYSVNTNPVQTSATGNFKVPVGAAYNVTVTDGVCSDTKSVTADPRPARIIVSAIGNDATKTITASVTSPVPVGVYDFKIVPDAKNAGFTPSHMWPSLTTGTPYRVYAKNAVGCIDSSAVVTLKNTGPIVIITDSICGNDSTGTANVSINFGKPLYSYALQYSPTKSGPYTVYKNKSFINKNQTLTNLKAGYYIISIRSGDAIDKTDTFYIHSKKIIVTPTADGDNMSIKIHADGGSKPYTYKLKYIPIKMSTPFGTDSVFNKLIKGDYMAYAADKTGCTDSTLIRLEPTKLKVVVTADTICKGNKGNARFAITNGAIPYLFKVWQPKDTMVNTLLYRQDTTLTNLNAGKYHYRLYDAVNDLERIDSFTVVETKIIIDTVFNSKAMTLTINASGGKAPYQYSLDGKTWSNTNAFAVKMQTYNLHVLDNRGCTDSLMVNLKGVLKVKYDILKDTICKKDLDGLVKITASGTSDYILSFTYNTDTPVEGITFADEGFEFPNMIEGSYKFHIEDAVGRTNDTTINIVASNLAINTPVANARTKTIMIHATGGSIPYTYGLDNWSILNTPRTDSVFKNLANPSYLAHVMDKYGCRDSVDVPLANPKLSVAVKMIKDTICLNSNDGEFIVLPRQGKSSYIMSIKKDGTPYTGKYSATFEMSDTIRNASVGAYQIMLTDTAGYVFDSTVNIVSVKPEVKLEQISVAGTHCGNDPAGKLEIKVSDGKPRTSNLFFYKWDAELQAGTQDTLNSKTTSKLTLDKVLPGDHILTLSDSLCTYKQTFNIPSDLPSISITKDVDNSDSARCSLPGKLTVKVQGGTPKATKQRYSYVWAKVTGGNAKDGYTSVILPQYTDSVATGIFAGEYFITVTDSMKCTATNLVPIDVPQYKTDLAITSAVDIKKRTITGFAKGGTKPYTFQLDGVENTVAKDSVFTVNENKTYILTVVDSLKCTASVDVLVLNPHLDVDIVMVKDTICLNSSDGEFIVQPRHGKSSYTMTINKDRLPYKGIYSTAFEISDTVRNIPIGKFRVIVADTAGYVFDSTVNIVAIKPQIQFEQTEVIGTHCGNDSTGKLRIKVWGGKPRSSGLYFYKWAPDLLVETQDTLNTLITDTVTLNKVPSGDHILTVNDSICTYHEIFNIPSELPSINISKDWMHSDTALCIKPGSLTIIASGGAPDYTKKQRYSYRWGKVTEQIAENGYMYTPLPETEYNDSVAHNLDPGGYLVWVTDTNKCTARNDLAFDVLQRNDMKLDIKAYRGGSPFKVTGNDTICYEDRLALKLNSLAGQDTIKTVSYNWLWSSAAKPTVVYQSISQDSLVSIATNDAPKYRVFAKMANSDICRVDSSVYIRVYPNPFILLARDTTLGKEDLPYRFGAPVDTTIIGGTYEYSWTAKDAETGTETAVLDYLNIKQPTFTLKDATAQSYLISVNVNYGVIREGIGQCSLLASTILNLTGGVDPQRAGNNVLTPNDDGENDFWYIKNAEYYPDITVEVFNRWGQKVFSQKKYDNQSKVWKGNYNGGRLPSGVYYYVIKLNNHSQALTGTVTILR